MITEDTSLHETIVSINIPIIAFRKIHSIPLVKKILLQQALRLSKAELEEKNIVCRFEDVWMDESLRII